MNCGPRDRGVIEVRRDGTMPSELSEEECRAPRPSFPDISLPPTPPPPSLPPLANRFDIETTFRSGHAFTVFPEEAGA